MAGIYILVTAVGAQSRGVYQASANGGEGLADIAAHYFGRAGVLILAITVTLACMKTAVGLVTSCGESFEKMFPNGPSYRAWAIIFSVCSFLVANLGLNAIIAYAIPVLMFLYPLAMTLILLSLFGKLFDYDRRVFIPVTGLTILSAIVDFLQALPEETLTMLGLGGIADKAQSFLPFGDLGFGWVCPALIGLVIGLLWHATAKVQNKNMI